MRNAKRDDIVTCERAGSGDYRVLNVFENGSHTELQIQSLDRQMDIQRFYEFHCVLNLKATLAARKERANVILTKPRRK